MLRIVFVLLPLFIFSCKQLIPASYRNYLSDSSWNSMRLAGDNELPIPSDSMVVMRSNRVFHPERLKFLGDYIDSSEKERTFLVVVKNGLRVVYQVSDIETAMSYYQTKKNLVVYVEGMGKNFYLAADRAIALAAQHDVSVIMMDYPSVNPVYGLAQNFRVAKQNSYNTAPAFLRLLSELASGKKKEQEWTKGSWTLFHHSMGNIMLKRILSEKADTVITSPLFNYVILNAACVDEKRHAEWLKTSRLGNRHIVHFNKADRQLNGAKLLTLKRQLGVKPRKPFTLNTWYINFNPLVGSRHSTFADLPLRPPVHPHAKAYYNLLFRGDLPDFSNQIFFEPCKKVPGYSLK